FLATSILSAAQIPLVAPLHRKLSATSARSSVAKSGQGSSASKTGRVEFLRDVAPILDRAGCSTAECHGKFGGRGGFQLSLLTLSPEDDYEPIVYGARGRRIDFENPADSLLLKKATGTVSHGGGARFARDSPFYRTILRWIEQGAEFRD